VSRIPEIQEIWQDLFYNPKTLSPHMTGVLQLLNMKTSRKYIQSRLTPDMEKKIQFLTAQVKFGNQKRYQDWFQKQVCAINMSFSHYPSKLSKVKVFFNRNGVIWSYSIYLRSSLKLSGQILFVILSASSIHPMKFSARTCSHGGP